MSIQIINNLYLRLNNSEIDAVYLIDGKTYCARTLKLIKTNLSFYLSVPSFKFYPACSDICCAVVPNYKEYTVLLFQCVNNIILSNFIQEQCVPGVVIIERLMIPNR